MKHAEDALARMRKNMKNDVSAYVIVFGPTAKSECTFQLHTRRGRSILDVRNNVDGRNVLSNVKRFVKMLLIDKIPIHAVALYCHGGTTGLGPWKKSVRPFLTVPDAVKTLIEPFSTATLVCFDACDQGNMSTLYEMPKHVRVVVASPEFHPYASILWTKAFGKLVAGMHRAALLTYAHSMVCEWHTFSRESWRGLLVFDMECVWKLAKEVDIHHEELIFDKRSQIEKEDANIHDFYIAARNLRHVQQLILWCVRASCDKCVSKRNKRIFGPSMDGHLPRKWISCYKSSKWYREIVKGRKGFERWRKAY